MVSEGDKAHGADAARARFKVTGTGVTVGVLSDGVDSLAASIASGDLPADTRVLPGQEGDGDEGTAMMEIVHDLAPNAHLLFATAFTSEESFADNIRALRAAGADIIVDDVVYFAESPFQDSGPAQAVIDVTNDGALYFSSAGNEQNVDDRTAGNWEGDYDASGQTIGKFAGEAHDWDPGPAAQVLNPVSDDSAGVPTILQWNDLQGHSGNDYDLYAVGADGSVLGVLQRRPGRRRRPVRGLQPAVRHRRPGRGEVQRREPLLPAHPVPRPVRGPARPDRLQHPGRHPRPLGRAGARSASPRCRRRPRSRARSRRACRTRPGRSRTSSPAPSSRRRSPPTGRAGSSTTRTAREITPGNLTSTGGFVRLKPDITAADGVSTSVPGFDPFYGTSAAAPHAAAIAALILSGNPGISPAEVRSALTGTAIDIEARGYDRDTGFGIVMPERALKQTGATPQPLVVADDPVITTSTDGDQFLEPGESATVSVPVTNRGDGTATGVSVQVTTPTAGATVTAGQPVVRDRQGRRDQDQRRSPSSVPASFPLGGTVELNIRVELRRRAVPAVRRRSRSRSASRARRRTSPTPVPRSRSRTPTTPASSVPLAVSGVGNIARVTFSIDGTTCSTDGASPTGRPGPHVRR